MTTREVLLVYDKECPVCDVYCQRVRIPESVGVLQLVNARDESVAMDEITRRGLDIDHGMVVIVDGVLHYGADAIHALTTMATHEGLSGRINRWMFGSAIRARVLYPALRSLRNLLLKILRKSRINNLRQPANSRF